MDNDLDNHTHRKIWVPDDGTRILRRGWETEGYEEDGLEGVRTTEGWEILRRVEGYEDRIEIKDRTDIVVSRAEATRSRCTHHDLVRVSLWGEEVGYLFETTLTLRLQSTDLLWSVVGHRPKSQCRGRHPTLVDLFLCHSY